MTKLRRANYMAIAFVLTIMIGLALGNCEPAPYNPDGKTDPFEPLFKPAVEVVVEKVVKVQPKINMDAEKRKKFLPLCKYEVSRMTLSAVIIGTEHRFASFTLPEADNRSYSARIGDYVGTDGAVVVKIGHGYVVLSDGTTIKAKQ